MDLSPKHFEVTGYNHMRAEKKAPPTFRREVQKMQFCKIAKREAFWHVQVKNAGLCKSVLPCFSCCHWFTAASIWVPRACDIYRPNAGDHCGCPLMGRHVSEDCVQVQIFKRCSRAWKHTKNGRNMGQNSGTAMKSYSSSDFGVSRGISALRQP